MVTNTTTLCATVNAKTDSTEHEPAVSCGSAIKVTHVYTGIGKYLLYDSEGKNRQGGSGQHLVTWQRDEPYNPRSLWRIRPAHTVVASSSQEDPKTEYPTVNTTTASTQVKTCNRVGDPHRNVQLLLDMQHPLT